MTEKRAMGKRAFGRVNWLGLATLTRREVQRFLAVWSQTVAAPVATSLLFLTVFSLAFGERRGDPDGVPFEVFLAPGILMMTVIQNAFANTSSSLMISKVQGNIVDTLMPPLSAGEILTGYVLGGVVRGVVCAAAIGLTLFPYLGIGVAHPLWALAFLLLASVMLSLVGLMTAILAEKFDQMAAITNLVITPLAFLSGTFYSISSLPPVFQSISHANPIFYLIDGFRFGVLGTSDANPLTGLVVALAVNTGLILVCGRWLATGYRLKS
ncbi:MAG: ABC transporter permease [Paracoccaceae bacterium]